MRNGISELQVSKGKVDLWCCLVKSHPQQQNPVGGTSVPNRQEISDGRY